jgi:hypothetical protein
MSIKENLQKVLDRIAAAAQRAGRDPASVQLVAISKTVEVERIREGLAAGITILGENKVQEAEAKIQELGHPVPWHLVGHLQTNKAKKAVGLFDMIHSLDSWKLAQELEKHAVAGARRALPLPVLVEVNIAQEETKAGVAEKELFDLLNKGKELRYIQVAGLMTMPPYFTDPEEARPYFRRLREMRDEAREQLGITLEHLSMGMSGDFEVAVEEGATMVRVGTAIWGKR